MDLDEERLLGPEILLPYLLPAVKGHAAPASRMVGVAEGKHHGVIRLQAHAGLEGRTTGMVRDGGVTADDTAQRNDACKPVCHKAEERLELCRSGPKFAADNTIAITGGTEFPHNLT